MNGEDPFAGFERDLNYWEVSNEKVELTIPDDVVDDDRELRFLVYTGLFDLLMETLWAHCEDESERDHEGARILSKVQSVEPTLRFSLYQDTDVAQRTELMARMRGKDVAVSEHFLVPRLERGLLMYEERIEALRAALRK